MTWNKQKKLSDLPPFQSKRLLYAAQKRGMEIFGSTLDANCLMLLGLAEMLWEANVGDIRKLELTDEQAEEFTRTEASKLNLPAR